MTAQHTFAIGDIHGCLIALKSLLSRIETSYPGGTIVFLGDYVDRGADSKGVIDLVRAGPQNSKWVWVALKGNHEDMMAGAMSGEHDVAWWIENGGAETLNSFVGGVSDDYADWIRSLPLYYADKHRIFVHAGMDDAVPLDEQTEHMMLWKRPATHFSGEYWGKHLVHGHTPSLQNPETVGNRTNIDSGAVYGGKLTCAVFADDVPGAPVEYISAKEPSP